MKSSWPEVSSIGSSVWIGDGMMGFGLLPHAPCGGGLGYRETRNALFRHRGAVLPSSSTLGLVGLSESTDRTIAHHLSVARTETTI